MKKLTLLALTGVLGLTMVGCASQTADVSTNEPTLVIDQTDVIDSSVYVVSTKKFSCDSGIKPSVQYVSDDQMVMTLGNTRSPFDLAPSASGERYSAKSGVYGTGGNWHQSGNEAIFDYMNAQGKFISARCTAQ